MPTVTAALTTNLICSYCMARLAPVDHLQDHLLLACRYVLLDGCYTALSLCCCISLKGLLSDTAWIALFAWHSVSKSRTTACSGEHTILLLVLEQIQWCKEAISVSCTEFGSPNWCAFLELAQWVSYHGYKFITGYDYYYYRQSNKSLILCWTKSIEVWSIQFWYTNAYHCLAGL